MIFVLVAAIALARSNLRHGRGDLVGAVRLGAVVAGAEALACLLVADHTAAIAREIRLLYAVTVFAAYDGLNVWVLYLALEPHVRRVWPESLVSWSRLLAAKWREPIVARDILIGTLMSMAMAVFMIVASSLAGSDHAAPMITRSLSPLLGGRYLLAAFVEALSQAVYMGLFSLILLLLMRTVLRRTRLAMAALFALLAVLIFSWAANLFAGTAMLLAVLALLIVAGWVFMLVRFGLLACVSTLFMLCLAILLPDATRFTTWYSTCTWAGVAAVLLPALYGLMYSTGKTPLFQLPPVEP